MRKKLCITSAALFVLWVVGFFVLGFSSPVHTVLWVAVIILIRSLFVCSTSNDVVVAKEK
jgi:hypothetical protein